MDQILRLIEDNAIIAVDFIQKNLLEISLTINFIFMLTYLISKLISIENKPNLNLYAILDILTDNEVEKVIIHLSNRIIIPVYFTKEQIITFVQKPNTLTFLNFEALWKYLINNNYVLSDDFNDIMHDWIQNITNNYDVTEQDISDISDDTEQTVEIVAQKEQTAQAEKVNQIKEDKPISLESALLTISYSILQEYAGINNKSKTKFQLVEIIIDNLNLLKKKMENRKLKILNKQLSY